LCGVALTFLCLALAILFKEKTQSHDTVIYKNISLMPPTPISNILMQCKNFKGVGKLHCSWMYKALQIGIDH